MLSRWYQSKLYNPGGILTRVFIIQTTKIASNITHVFFVIKRIRASWHGSNLVFLAIYRLVIMGLFFFHGLSVIHFNGRENK